MKCLKPQIARSFMCSVICVALILLGARTCWWNNYAAAAPPDSEAQTNESMTPEEAVSQIEKETKSKPGKEGSNSKEVFKVSFRVQRVFIPIGLQPKGTPLPIGFVPRPD